MEFPKITVRILYNLINTSIFCVKGTPPLHNHKTDMVRGGEVSFIQNFEQFCRKVLPDQNDHSRKIDRLYLINITTYLPKSYTFLFICMG